MAAVIVATFLVSGTADAKKYLSVQTWRPSPHSLDLFQVEGARINHGYTATAYMMYNVAGDPAPYIDVLGTLDVLASVSLWDFVSFGIDLPLHLHRSGDEPAGVEGFPAGSFAVGDLRASLKGTILRPRVHGIGFAVSLEVGAPTAMDEPLVGEEGVTLRPRLIFEGVNRWVQTVVNIGYLKRFETSRIGPLRVEDELEFMLGFGFTPGPEQLKFILEADFASRVNRFFEDETTRLEIDAGLRYRFSNDLALQVGGGAGVLDGYGDPGWRVFASFGYMPATFAEPPVFDTDADGIDDPQDNCPTNPEDFDGYEDGDGCPEIDNDRDGVPDTSDRCPMDPEDMDGFEDIDGCPEPDNDGDGVLDRDDGCPLDPEDKDGYQDQDGCPEPDNDGDGIPDVSDQCPLEPEDFDNCQDQDGCPEPGNICVTEKKLVISDKIFFRTNRAKIKSVSYPLLDEIAMVINAHPEILVIEVQGHTDSRGRDRYNMKLSAKRAKAVVDYLVKRGRVDPSRLVSKGYGETQPIASNDTEEGRAMNRRVEFVILQRAEKK